MGVRAMVNVNVAMEIMTFLIVDAIPIPRSKITRKTYKPKVFLFVYCDCY
jgi:hypothetical protein